MNNHTEENWAFNVGDTVRKKKGAQWKGTVVGFYSTTLTPEGYAVESSTEHGSVQIYPVAALDPTNEGNVGSNNAQLHYSSHEDKLRCNWM